MTAPCWQAFFFGAIFGVNVLIASALALVIAILMWLAGRGRRQAAEQNQQRMRTAAERAASMTDAAAARKES